MTGVGLIGVGAPKCGTSLLASLLHEEPALCWPQTFSNKEINFFTTRYDNYARGIDWYLSHFDHCVPGRIRCEFSPSYFSDPESPELIGQHFPDVRLLAILRDPARRAFSAFQHDKRACRIPSDVSFEEARRSEPKYIRDSRYDVHLRRYMQTFGADQIHVMFLEELTDDVEGELSRFYEFLDAESVTGVAPMEIERTNEAWLPRSYALEKFLRLASGITKALGLRPVVETVREAGAERLLRALNSQPAEELKAESHKDLLAEFSESDRNLKELLGRTRLPWEVEA